MFFNGGKAANLRAAGLAIVAGLMATNSAAFAASNTMPAAAANQRVLYASLGETTRSPIGWVEFCNDNPGDCGGGPTQPRDIVMTQAAWKDLLRVNHWVNENVKPLTDMDHWGVVEKWSYPTDGYGDCEDYVLEKRRRLMQAGYPRQALLITVVRDHKGDGHAVLTVKTDRGDFILDNQAAKVLAWSETCYRFIKRQSQEHPNRWVSLGGFDTASVAGTKR